MSNEDELGTTVLKRKTKYQPRRSWQTWLIGRPLPTSDAPHQTIGKFLGLAVFSSDALSSVAYATQEMLVILAVLGASAYQFVFPLSLAIVFLLAIVTLSYEQTIHAYPNGGGSYIVSRDNLGEIPAQVAGAALLVDYLLTVAVSVSSGVAQIVSAAPSLYPYRVLISVGLVLFIMVVNLRGVKESGIVFAFPTYFFIITMFLTIGAGLVRSFTGALGQVSAPPSLEVHQIGQSLSIFLLLRAFSSGTSAMTGVEAISNGIPAFREPRTKNAGATLIIMACILGSMLLGISFLASFVHAVPSETETVISQIARTTFNGRGVFYWFTMIATTVILIMAANTSFADFPRLSAIMASDGFLPRQLAYRGSRLVYSRGIVSLGILASILIVIFQASVTRLIPLYAIGVFLSFTLSQLGMVHRWWKIGHLKPGEERKERGSILTSQRNWKIKLAINGLGAIITSIVVVIFATTKFSEGAWLVTIIIPLAVLAFSRIHRHYRNLAKKLSLENFGSPPPISRHRIIIPIGGVHRGTLQALRYAKTISDDITAVYVSLDPIEAEKVRQKWEIWGMGCRLVILDSPFRLFIEPLLEYIDEIDKRRQPNEAITIVVPEFIPCHFWNRFLHARTASVLRQALMFRKEIVVTSVPYLVD